MRPFMVIGMILFLVGVLALAYACAIYATAADPAALYGVPAFICSGVAVVVGLILMAMGRMSPRRT